MMTGWPYRPPLFMLRGDKLTAYLLNPNHPRGGSKARFFLGFGFNAATLDVLAVALLKHGQFADLASTELTGWGMRYKFLGPISAPDGREPTILTVWQLEQPGDSHAKFVTAFPA